MTQILSYNKNNEIVVLQVDTNGKNPSISINRLICELRNTREGNPAYNNYFFGNVCFNIVLNKAVKEEWITQEFANTTLFKQDIPSEVIEYFFPEYQLL